MIAAMIIGVAVTGLGSGAVLYMIENWQEVKVSWFGIQTNQ